MQSIATRYGIEWRTLGGSHVVFSKSGVDFDLSVPAKRPIKPIYIRLFLEMIDKVNNHD